MITTLRRWLSGEGRASDERALDSATHGDPFLAEAMEGYRAFADADHEKNLARLRARLKEKSGKQRSGGVYFLPRAVAVAASVLIMAGMGWWIFRESPDHQSLTKNEAEAIAPTDTGGALAQAESATTPISPEEQAAPPATTLYRYNRRSKELKVVPITPPEPADEAFVEEEINDDDLATAGEAASKPKVADKVLDLPAEAAPSKSENDIAYQPASPKTAPATPGNRAREEAKKDMADNGTLSNTKLNNLRNLIGRVTDAAGEPLIGVNILVEGTNRGTVTDFDGNFNLPLSGDEKRLLFQYTGYETLTEAISDRGTMNVTLKEGAMALSEVVISGYASKKQKSSKAKPERSTAVPSVGIDAYETYLRQNLRYPAAAREKGIQGVVKLRFTVSATGKLSNFKILEPLRYGCDEEAIRLIREGPAWEINGDARKVQVVWEIRF
ncbi:MAG: TonB family protein [Saprospiraceae bacterium]|nr:TonB family protein [Saprospiraceae bacterium]